MFLNSTTVLIQFSTCLCSICQAIQCKGEQHVVVALWFVSPRSIGNQGHLAKLTFFHGTQRSSGSGKTRMQESSIVSHLAALTALCDCYFDPLSIKITTLEWQNLHFLVELWQPFSSTFCLHWQNCCPDEVCYLVVAILSEVGFTDQWNRE